MNNRNVLRINKMCFDWRNPASAPRLSRAVRQNDVEGVKKLLNYKSIGVNAADNRGYTALHESASDEKYLEIAKLLLEAGAYPNHVTVDDETPLHIACYNTNIKMVKLLLSYNCDVEKKNVQGFTPLYIACEKNNANIVEQLIRAGADLNSEDFGLKTPIYAAIEKGSVQVLKLLLSKGVNTKVSDCFSRTILRFACVFYNPEIFDILLKHYGNTYGLINYQSDDGWTALMDAIQSKNIQAIEKLLKHSADPNLPDRRLILPLHIAAHTGSMECFKLILNITNRSLIERFSVKINGNTSMRSLPCLLIDTNMYEGLELLLSLNYSLDVYTCPVRIEPYTFSPICFLLAQRSCASSLKLKFFNLLLPKEQLTERFYKSTNEDLSPLDAVSIMHSRPHKTCICLKIAEILLEKGVDPDGQFLINKEIPLLFLKMIKTGFIEYIKLILRYSSIDPEDLIPVFFNRIIQSIFKRKYPWTNREIEMTEFLLKICTDFTIGYELVYKNIKPKSFIGIDEIYNDINMIYNMVKSERKVHSLYSLARTAVRKSLKNNGQQIRLIIKIENLKLPKSVKLYLRYYDLTEE